MGASVVVNLPISDLVPAVLGVHAQLKEVTLILRFEFLLTERISCVDYIADTISGEIFWFLFFVVSIQSWKF
ncbi:hypothetical protein HanIR_Chr12g0607341 [Helianthus annuus]|nr:hypothetical protein HanIR_Chr12g0607341 [Helianthus annuus]